MVLARSRSLWFASRISCDRSRKAWWQSKNKQGEVSKGKGEEGGGRTVAGIARASALCECVSGYARRGVQAQTWAMVLMTSTRSAVDSACECNGRQRGP